LAARLVTINFAAADEDADDEADRGGDVRRIRPEDHRQDGRPEVDGVAVATPRTGAHEGRLVDVRPGRWCRRSLCPLKRALAGNPAV
jgi:hypothetical protein